MPQLDEYGPFIGPQGLDALRSAARFLRHRSVVHVNSTALGGGVAEILHRMVPLLNELGVRSRWEVIKGGEAFYAVTKRMHNALHGKAELITESDIALFRQAQEENIRQLKLDDDIVFIHDPQPIGLVEQRTRYRNRWIWRCHVDVSAPDPGVWAFLKPYIERYDKAVFSAESFSRDLSIPKAIICPSIDPLSDKNRELSADEIIAVIERLRLPLDKPLVTQVSRFDRLKDPVGLIRAFRAARSEVDARLLLVGGSADDDPEGAQVLNEVQKEAAHDPDILILVLAPTCHLEINAIQRASTVLVQKSLREGFGLTITEALWKSKPVIAGNVGGIPLQVLHERTGVLVNSEAETAHWIKRLILDPELRTILGANGREHVMKNFLLTRHIADYLELFRSVLI